MRPANCRAPLVGVGVGVVVALELLSVACAHDPQHFNAPAVTHEQQPAYPSPQGDRVHPSPGEPQPASPDQIGLATWYGKRFAGKPTSNGERFDPRAMTAAHRKLPFGTWVEVRRAETGRSVRVRINDRGPWGDDRRIIDLSQAAAELLGIVAEGVARVELYVIRSPPR